MGVHTGQQIVEDNPKTSRYLPLYCPYWRWFQNIKKSKEKKACYQVSQGKGDKDNGKQKPGYLINNYLPWINPAQDTVASVG